MAVQSYQEGALTHTVPRVQFNFIATSYLVAFIKKKKKRNALDIRPPSILDAPRFEMHVTDEL